MVILGYLYCMVGLKNSNLLALFHRVALLRNIFLKSPVFWLLFLVSFGEILSNRRRVMAVEDKLGGTFIVIFFGGE